MDEAMGSAFAYSL